jgi:hypothetical protein
MVSNTGAHFASLPFIIGGKMFSNNAENAASVMIGLSLLFIAAFTIKRFKWPRQWALATTMVALIMVTSGCSLLNGGIMTSTDVVVISMFTKTTITAPIPGTVTITATVDAETLTTVIHFVVELPPTSWEKNEAPQISIFLPKAILKT